MYTHLFHARLKIILVFLMASFAIANCAQYTSVLSTSHIMKPIIENLHSLPRSAPDTNVDDIEGENEDGSSYKQQDIPFNNNRAYQQDARANSAGKGNAKTQGVFLSKNFQGQSYDANINVVDPPDPVIAVGPDADPNLSGSKKYIVECVNRTLAIYDGNGNLVISSAFKDIFGSAADACGLSAIAQKNSVGIKYADPKVIYDQYANHFVVEVLGIVQLFQSGEFHTYASFYMVAASKTADPTGYWWKYGLDSDLNNGVSTSTYADYPGLACDQNAVYITADMIDGLNQVIHGDQIRMIAKNNTSTNKGLYNDHGIDASVYRDYTTSYDGLKPAQFHGTQDNNKFFLLANNAKAASGTGTGNYGVSGDYMYLYEFDYPSDFPNSFPANYNNNMPTSIHVNHFDPPDQARQGNGNGSFINTMHSETQDVTYRDGYLYATFSENLTGPDGIGYSAIRYLKIDAHAQTTVIDATFGDVIDKAYYYYPNITITSSGTIFLVFNCSSLNIDPGVYYAYRIPSDAIMGGTDGSQILKQGACPSIHNQSSFQSQSFDRYGDYSGIAIDPSDENRIWFCGEWEDCGSESATYPNSFVSGSWSTQIGEFDAKANVQFVNAINSQNADPTSTLLVNSTTVVSSGGSTPVPLGANNVMTQSERFLNPSGFATGTYKHHDWNDQNGNPDNTQFLFPHNFSIVSNTSATPQQANFQPLQPAIIANTLEGGLLMNEGVVNFWDPWYATAISPTGQPNTLMPSPVPFSPTGMAGQSSGGVFLNQGNLGSLQQPYYTLNAPYLLANNGTYSAIADIPLDNTTIGDVFVPICWDAKDVNGNPISSTTAFGAPLQTAQQTPVVFTTQHETITAHYKAHLATLNGAGGVSGNTMGLPSNSQRTIVYKGPITIPPPTGGGQYIDNRVSVYNTPLDAMIYIDMNKLYFVLSTDNGQTWSPDQRIDNTGTVDVGYVGTASMCIRSDGSIGVVYEDYSEVDNKTVFEPVLDLAVGTLSNYTVSYTWNVSGFAALPAWNTSATAGLLCGLHPVIAPYVTAGYMGWWIAWAHPTQYAGAVNPSEGIPVGVYVGYSFLNGGECVSIDPNSPMMNRMPNSFDPMFIKPAGDNPSISASYMDAYTYAAPYTIANGKGGGASTQTTVNDVWSTFGAGEGDTLHIAWEYANQIYYNEVWLSALQGPIGFKAISEEPSQWADAFATYFPGASWLHQWLQNNGKPSLAVDDYIENNYFDNGNPDHYEEPVVAWEIRKAPYGFAGEISLIPINNIPSLHVVIPPIGLMGIGLNRRGNSVDMHLQQFLNNNPQMPWADNAIPRQFANLWLVNPSIASVRNSQYAMLIDHPSVTTFPSDSKTENTLVAAVNPQNPQLNTYSVANDLQAALTFHYNDQLTALFGDRTCTAYSYFVPMPLGTSTWLSRNNVLNNCTGCLAFPYETFVYPGLGTASGQGAIEQHFSYDPYGVTPYSTGGYTQGNTGIVAYKEVLQNAANIAIPVYNYGLIAPPSNNLAFGKSISGSSNRNIADVPSNLGGAGHDYLGCVTSFDSAGAAAIILGEVVLNQGTSSAEGILMHPVAPDVIDTTAIPDTSLAQCIRSMSFPLQSGQSVTAGVYLLSDSNDLINMMQDNKMAFYSIDVVDSITGEVRIPLYHIMIGGSDSINIPSVFPTFVYSGPPSPAAYVRMSVQVSSPDAMYKLSGVAVHVISDSTTGLGKATHPQNIFAMLPTDQLKIFPNPTTDWSQFEYNIYQAGHVQVQVYDMLGRMVKQVVDKYQPNGHYALAFDTEDLPSGYYKVNILVDGNLSSVGDMVVKK